MASENFNNNGNNKIFLDRNKLINHPNLDPKAQFQSNYANNLNGNCVAHKNNYQNIIKNNKTNNSLDALEHCRNNENSIYFKNQNELKSDFSNPINIENNYNQNYIHQTSNYNALQYEKSKFETWNEFNNNNNQEKNLNNSFNFNSSNFNNTLMNKSTNNNTRYSFDYKEISKDQKIENNSINKNWNDSAEAEEIDSNKNHKLPASKRNISLNPSILKNINNPKRDFHNSVINNKHQMNIIPEISSQPFSSLTEKKNKNLFLNVETENSLCYYCHDIVEDNEIIYFCSCERIFHFSCLSDFLTKKGKTIHNSCEECENDYKIFYFKLIIKDEEADLTEFKFPEFSKNNSIGKSCLNGNNSINLNNSSFIDTNINNLENYEALCGLAMQINHESMFELISKNENNKNAYRNTTPHSIGRIPLSPIPINTPYTGKTKTINLSNMNENSENIKFNEGISNIKFIDII